VAEQQQAKAQASGGVPHAGADHTLAGAQTIIRFARNASALDVDLENQFGKYELVARLAAGGMAEIFKARSPRRRA